LPQPLAGAEGRIAKAVQSVYEEISEALQHPGYKYIEEVVGELAVQEALESPAKVLSTMVASRASEVVQ